MKKLCVLFAFLPVCFAVFGQNALPRLAVVEFNTNNRQERTMQDAVMVRNLVESQMIATGKYQIITRDEIDKLLANQQIAVSSISSSENVKKLQLQNISYIVTGSVDAAGDSYVVTVKMLDVGTGQFSHSADAFMAGEPAAMYGGIRTLVGAFAAGMGNQGETIVRQAEQPASAPARSEGGAPSGIGIKVTTALAGVLYFQGEEAATLWDNDSYTIPIERPGTYTVKMRFGNGKEVSRSIVIVSRGIAEARFGYPPGNVRTGSAGITSMPLSWDNAGSGVSYRVYYGRENNPDRAWAYGAAVNGTAVTVGNLTGSTAYYFWVSTVENGMESVKSAAASGRTREPPNPPGNVRAGTAAVTSVPLSWDSAGSGISYRVYYGTENNPDRARTYGGTVGGTSVTVGNLNDNTAYYFWVCAVEDGAESVKSAVASGRTKEWVLEGFVRIAGGTFMMGSPASEAERLHDREGPQHSVTVSGFYISKYEVTQKEWTEVMGSNPSNFKGDNLPVENVSWYDAIEYCNRRSVKEGFTPAYTRSGDNVTWNRGANGYRLPTEAEWEYACRAGTTGPFSTGSNITTSQANYDGRYPYNGNAKGIYRGKTWNVGSGSANAWGLYDMHGNVWEWCWDWYGSYSGYAQTDPVGASSGSNRLNRGGSWINTARNARSAYRSNNTPSSRSLNLGFRLVRP
ncbi:MAG: SUMF1/EgtB/PvdO family nonheme iron enzyme [Treponema sp.]|jgi:formylglycine-generating enzyme required for sulfatase activity|nr:SUMF1/EgtB/PvdO family nonheme iron enzyme [Treponema sp.]